MKLNSHHSYIELVFIIVHATVGRGHNFLLSTKMATDHDGGGKLKKYMICAIIYVSCVLYVW